jgi:hypothetical protein
MSGDGAQITIPGVFTALLPHDHCLILILIQTLTMMTTMLHQACLESRRGRLLPSVQEEGTLLGPQAQRLVMRLLHGVVSSRTRQLLQAHLCL